MQRRYIHGKCGSSQQMTHRRANNNCINFATFASPIVFRSSIVLGHTFVNLSVQCDLNQKSSGLKSRLLAG